MEKRRRALRLAAAAAGLSWIPAWACTPAIQGATLESASYVLAFRASPVAVATHFNLDVAACAKSGGPPPAELKIDAHMPEHRHGMNYAPSVKALGPGRWRAEGLMFHMPGRWEFAFELLRQRGVSVAPGTAFGQVAADAVRISLASSESDLEEGVGRLAKFVLGRT